MSKRYGRTQKRNHLFRIAQLEKEIDLIKSQNRIDNDRGTYFKNKLEHLINAIVRVAHNSALVFPEIQFSPPNFPGSAAYKTYKSLDLPRFSDIFREGSIPEYIPVETVDVRRLELFIRDNAEFFQKIVHLRLSGDTKDEVRYMISNDALKHLPPEMIAEYISDMTLKMIQYLQNHLRDKENIGVKKARTQRNTEPKEL